MLLNTFEEIDKKFNIQEEKYATKKIRRLVIIDNSTSKFDEKNSAHKFIMDCIRVKILKFKNN